MPAMNNKMLKLNYTIYDNCLKPEIFIDKSLKKQARPNPEK